MNANTLMLLKQLIDHAHKNQEPEASSGAFFEFFSASQLLRDYHVDPEEIKAGICGQEFVTHESSGKAKGVDGGVDAMYIFVDGAMLRDTAQAADLAKLKHSPRFDVVLIQCSRDEFSLTAVVRMTDTARAIFDIERPPSQFSERYNAKFLESVEIFRAAHAALLPKHPSVSVSANYVTLGDKNFLESNNSDVLAKAEEFKTELPKLLATIRQAPKFEFVGANELYEYSRLAAEPIKHELKCVDSCKDDKGGVVALSSLSEVFKLVSSDGELREVLFEWNVRDYQIDTPVNLQIRETLNERNGPEFWWLNNGITILAAEITSPNNRRVHITNPRIVNGLQTSEEIYHYLKTSSDSDSRLALVRIIPAGDDSLQNRIIQATNTQNKMPIEALRATDPFQCQIEQYFRANGLHYDRRKNSWRKSNKPLSKVVGISDLAQSVASVVNKQPDNARARPSKFFKNDQYSKIFRTGTPLETYLFCAKLRKRMESHLKRSGVDARTRSNLLFYCLTAVAFLMAKSRAKITSAAADDLPNKILDDALLIVRPIYDSNGGDDGAAKGTKMIESLKDLFSRKRKAPAA